jgi:hypothetical protein
MARSRRNHPVVSIVLALLIGAAVALPGADARAGRGRPAATAKKKPRPKVKPPKRDACREKCDHFNKIADCADEEGHMMPCPCHCP